MSARLEGFDHRHSQKLDFALNAVLSGPMSSVSNKKLKPGQAARGVIWTA